MLYQQEVKATKSYPKAVLSSYPPGFSQDDPPYKGGSKGTRLCTCEFSMSDVEHKVSVFSLDILDNRSLLTVLSFSFLTKKSLHIRHRLYGSIPAIIVGGRKSTPPRLRILLLGFSSHGLNFWWMCLLIHICLGESASKHGPSLFDSSF